MGPRSIPVSRAALAAAAALALVALMGAPAGAQDDLCDALTLTEIATAIPGTYDAPGGFSDACQWHGSTVSGDAVDVILYLIPGSLGDFDVDPAAVDVNVAGLPALSFTDMTTDPPAGAVAVEVGGDVVLLTVSAGDPGVDPGAAASQLASSAVSRIAEGGASAPEPDATPVESTHGDPCSIFSAETLSELMGTTLSAFPDGEACRWESDDSGASVSISFAEGSLATLKTLYPDGEDIMVAGQPAFEVDQSFPGMAAWQIDVDLGPDTVSLLVISTDETLDVASIARELSESAFDNGLRVLPEPEGVVTACGLATPEEIAAAAGIDAKLSVLDYEIACTYEGGEGNKHVIIYVAMQDAAMFEMAIQALGGTEIDGPGERSWWLADYDSLATLQGDLGLQVTLTRDTETTEAKLQQTTVAIMEALLAPPA
jgi:hypothetical protein